MKSTAKGSNLRGARRFSYGDPISESRLHGFSDRIVRATFDNFAIDGGGITTVR